MKKLLAIIILIIIFTFSTIQQVQANAHWNNPKEIKTYIEPNQKTELMKEAFARWTQISNGNLVFKYVSNPSDAQIRVIFVKDAEKASNMENALGVTYHRSLGEYMISADIEIADNAPNGAMLRKDAVYRIMVHEIGHAIGIFEHSNDPMSIMFYAKGSRNQNITTADLQLLKTLYRW